MIMSMKVAPYEEPSRAVEKESTENRNIEESQACRADSDGPRTRLGSLGQSQTSGRRWDGPDSQSHTCSFVTTSSIILGHSADSATRLVLVLVFVSALH